MSLTVHQVKEFFTKVILDLKGDPITNTLMFLNMCTLDDINNNPELLKSLIEFISLVKNSIVENESLDTNKDKLYITPYVEQIIVNFVNGFTITDSNTVESYKPYSRKEIKLLNKLLKLEPMSWSDDGVISLIQRLNGANTRLITAHTTLKVLYGLEDTPTFVTALDIVNYSLSNDKIVYLTMFFFKQLLNFKENEDVVKIVGDTYTISGNAVEFQKEGKYIIYKHSDELWKLVPWSFLNL